MGKGFAKALLMFFLVFLCVPAGHAALVLDLKAFDYNPTTGVWTDSSGNGDNAAPGNKPAMVAGQTPNGSPVVHFSGSNFLSLTAGISSSEFTAFAYVRPASGDSRTIVGGATGSFQYRIGGDGFGDKQEVLRRNQVRIAVSNTNVSTMGFSTIDVAINGGGGGFRLNGINDGTTPGGTFSSPTNLVGAASGPNEFYSGDIAEIRIYNTMLTEAERAAVEADLGATYGAPIPEPGSLALAALSTLGLLGYGWRRRRRPE